MLNYDFKQGKEVVTIVISGVKFKVKGTPIKSINFLPRTTQGNLSDKVPVLTLNYGSISIINVNNEEFNLWYRADQYLLPQEFGSKLWRALIGRESP